MSAAANTAYTNLINKGWTIAYTTHKPMDNTIYYVCHGPAAVHYAELEQGSTLESGQPNIEQFDNEQGQASC